MAILLNPFQKGKNYHEFLFYSQRSKQDRLGLSVGRVQNDNFLENYYFALASLKGYPLYSQLAKLIDNELMKELTDSSSVISYYHTFLNNCSDLELTEPLKKVYETANKLKIGNTFPIKSFSLKDSSIFNLEKFKGKPVCLILLQGGIWYIADQHEILKFKENEVEFIIARLPTKNGYGKEFDGSILEKPNVTVIELLEQDQLQKLLKIRSRIFMLDKWFRIVENDGEDLTINRYYGKEVSKFEKSLRKTIETKRYSKAEKTAMIKTAGWSFGSILFTFLGGLWIYRIRVRRIKTQEAAKRRIKELEIKAIRSQMNPHFIFNALNSIQSLINGNQFREANIYLSKFAVLLRGVLNNSEKNRISLADELQAVELYCQLEQLRFEFSFHIGIEPDLKEDLIEIPGMIIQPLVENAVVHGLSGKGASGELDIQVKRLNGNLCVCVSDNGVGLSETKIDELSQKGFGLKLVEERINILNLDGKEARLTLENRSDVTGTLATLIIPID
jgi:two-component sensor histidine kinase